MIGRNLCNDINPPARTYLAVANSDFTIYRRMVAGLHTSHYNLASGMLIPAEISISKPLEVRRPAAWYAPVIIFDPPFVLLLRQLLL